MRNSWSLWSLLAVAVSTACLPAQTQAGEPAGATPAVGAASRVENAVWQSFVSRNGGQWMQQPCVATGTPRAVYGTGLPIADWRENTLAEARRHAAKLLHDESELLGLGTSEFREILGSRIGRQWSFVYDQFFRGLPVIGGRADVRVSMAGRVAMFGSSAWQIGADFDTAPQVGPEVAAAAAWQALGTAPTGVAQPATTAAPRLVVWGDVAATARAPFFLAWEVAVSNVDQNGNGSIGRYYVDARTAAVLHFTSDKHECGFAGCEVTTPGAHPAAAAPAAPPPCR